MLQHDCEPNALVRFTSNFEADVGFNVELLALSNVKKGEACLIDYIDLDEAFEDYFADGAEAGEVEVEKGEVEKNGEPDSDDEDGSERGR